MIDELELIHRLQVYAAALTAVVVSSATFVYAAFFFGGVS